MKNEARIGDFTVAGQPTDGELAGLKSQGYGTVVNVRPPQELDEPEGPKVEGDGLRYVEVGFTAATLRPEHISQIKSAMAGLPGEVLIHCAGGTRAAVPAAIFTAEREGGDADEAIRLAENAGFEIAGTPYERVIREYFAKKG